jgi:hypothetical protein
VSPCPHIQNYPLSYCRTGHPPVSFAILSSRAVASSPIFPTQRISWTCSWRWWETWLTDKVTHCRIAMKQWTNYRMSMPEIAWIEVSGKKRCRCWAIHPNMTYSIFSLSTFHATATFVSDDLVFYAWACYIHPPKLPLHVLDTPSIYSGRE